MKLAATDRVFRQDEGPGSALVPVWHRELWRFAPPSTTNGWLRMVWVPGDPWKPVQRWMVWEMEPRAINPTAWYWEELEGPDPRTRGYYDKVLQRFVPSPDQLIDRLTWSLYRETGCMGRPFWVLQGATGGHRHNYDQDEQYLLRQRELPTEPPKPGALPFCLPDQRTWDSIAFYDRQGQVVDKIRSLKPAERKEAIRQANKALLRELESHVEAAVRDTGGDDLMVGVRRSDEEPDTLGAAYEQMQDRFINHV